jgi:hypothetical protein
MRDDSIPWALPPLTTRDAMLVECRCIPIDGGRTVLCLAKVEKQEGEELPTWGSVGLVCLVESPCAADLTELNPSGALSLVNRGTPAEMCVWRSPRAEARAAARGGVFVATLAVPRNAPFNRTGPLCTVHSFVEWLVGSDSPASEGAASPAAPEEATSWLGSFFSFGVSPAPPTPSRVGHRFQCHLDTRLAEPWSPVVGCASRLDGALGFEESSEEECFLRELEEDPSECMSLVPPRREAMGWAGRAPHAESSSSRIRIAVDRKLVCWATLHPSALSVEPGGCIGGSFEFSESAHPPKEVCVEILSVESICDLLLDDDEPDRDIVPAPVCQGSHTCAGCRLDKQLQDEAFDPEVSDWSDQVLHLLKRHAMIDVTKLARARVDKGGSVSDCCPVVKCVAAWSCGLKAVQAADWELPIPLEACPTCCCLQVRTNYFLRLRLWLLAPGSSPIEWIAPVIVGSSPHRQTVVSNVTSRSGTMRAVEMQ